MLRVEDELCVVADGARSQLHGHQPVEVCRPHARGAHWCLLRDEKWRFHGELYEALHGTREMGGALPTGLGPEGEVSYVSVFSSLRASELEAWRARGLDAWKGRVAEFIPALAPLLGQVESLDDVLFTRYQDVSMPRWHDGRVVYLGDAAHAMSPQLGQGANLALWDAMMLGDALRAADRIDDGLAAYSERRRSHLRFYQAANRWTTLWFHSDYNGLGALRDAAMPWSLRVPLVYRAMVTTMAGVNRGLGVFDTEALP